MGQFFCASLLPYPQMIQTEYQMRLPLVRTVLIVALSICLANHKARILQQTAGSGVGHRYDRFSGYHPKALIVKIALGLAQMPNVKTG